MTDKSTSQPVLYGMRFSVYVRICRMTFMERQVDHELHEVDSFDPDRPDWFKQMQPFGKMPAMRHGDVDLYETRAITSYIEAAFDGPRLTPDHPADRARVRQLQSIADNYLYRPMVRVLYVQESDAVREGTTPDKTAIKEASAQIVTGLDALEHLFNGDKFALPDFTLADIQLAPIFDYFLRAPSAPQLMANRPRLMTWWEAISRRKSFNDAAYSDPEGPIPPLQI